jgi:uncharacterized glyoxalase superfamily protein PhnB
MSSHNPTVWPTLSYEDAPAAIEFLTAAFGFEAAADFRHSDPSRVDHAQLRWPDGTGGVMLSSTRDDDSPWAKRATGNDAVYVVCEDPDALFERARAAGAEVVMGLTDTDYGSRDCTFRDPEGNLWSFGTYAGE